MDTSQKSESRVFGIIGVMVLLIIGAFVVFSMVNTRNGATPAANPQDEQVTITGTPAENQEEPTEENPTSTPVATPKDLDELETEIDQILEEVDGTEDFSDFSDTDAGVE